MNICQNQLEKKKERISNYIGKRLSALIGHTVIKVGFETVLTMEKTVRKRGIERPRWNITV